MQKYKCYTFYDQYSKFYTFSSVYQVELWNQLFKMENETIRMNEFNYKLILIWF